MRLKDWMNSTAEDRAKDRISKLENELYEANQKLQMAKEALEGIRAKSYSWMITYETGSIEKQIHDGYRARAQKALEKIKE